MSARAPFAVGPSRGRVFAEPSSPTRSDYQRDRDRIVHSTAFRRLADKTQVFVPHEGDHFRTRLTHTIEVAQIARALARALALDDDLAEALALAHDLGHTPFGHTGEDVLDMRMRHAGGFDHNAQALRVVTKLEHRYAAFDGLNLTWETLEGLVKHNGPLLCADGSPTAQYAARGVPAAIAEFDRDHALHLRSFASAEAQCAALADDIAYNAHDLDDGLRAGLFGLDALRSIPFLNTLLDEIDAAWPALARARAIHEIVRRVITRFVEDAIAESLRRIREMRVCSVDDIRRLAAPVVAFSFTMAAADKDIKRFLLANMYRAGKVMAIRRQAAGVVEALFDAFAADSAAMPGDWAAAARSADTDSKRLRIVCDYIAGMTDRFALAEHTRLFGSAPALR